MEKKAVKLTKKVGQLIISAHDLAHGNLKNARYGIVYRPVKHKDKSLTGGIMKDNKLIHVKFRHDLCVWVS